MVSVALCDQTAVDVDHLYAAAGGRVSRSPDDASAIGASAVAVRPSSRPPRHARIAHRRHRPPDDRMCACHEKPRRRRRNVVDHEEAEAAERAQRRLKGSCLHVGHCLPPLTTPGGTSSKSDSSLNSTFFAFAGAFSAKVSAPIGASVFQSVMRSVYCGPLVTALLVMTNLQGIGCAPVLIQICQSVSRLRKARCSHSTPLMIPRPICLASITSALSTL